MKLEKFLLQATNEYNGHKQTEIGEISLKKVLKLCSKLEEINGNCFVAHIHSDGGGSIYEEGYWEEGEHHLGHKDRLICGFVLEGFGAKWK